MSVASGAASRGAVSEDERLANRGSFRRLLVRPEMGAVSGAIVVWAFFAVVAGDRGFLSLGGTSNYLAVSAELGILAVAVALLMIGGEFDLSIGSTLGACGMIVAILSAERGWNIWLAILAALVFALAIGFINGVFVHRTGLPSFIVTLGMLFVIRGATIGLTRRETGRTQVGGLAKSDGYDAAHTVFASQLEIGGASFSVSILWWLAIAALATWILLRTQFGNWITGVGGNAQAARNVGVPVARVRVLLFMGTAVSAWLVAVIQAVNFTGSDVLRGQFREFYAIVAVVIGGTLLTGGYGTAIGAVLGALIYGMVQQGIVFAGVDADWFQVFLGGMLLAAVLINRFVRNRAVGGTR
ncbi:MAG TPA: ABC transporter permease [Thermomicrobiales bacterium]|nr:ABC transporter permease [Thermomicrobiales bacterium]